MSTMSLENILAESEREGSRYAWEGSFADYLRMVVDNPSLSRLSHSVIYEAILSEGIDTTPDGQPIYGLFKDQIFGLERALDRIVQYFAASAQRLEVRKRILLLLGPPAAGKSSIVDLLKRAIERYTRTEAGAVYAIRGCPMQEEPLHLIPPRLRPELQDQYGIYVEGHLCPRCRYVLRTEYNGKVSEMPVTRVTLSEQDAIGIGYYVATNPNPSDALLVGSVDTSQLDGDRIEVAGKAFRLDGELNIANRGMMEFVEMFKADWHLLTTLLGLAQEQLIKMEKFGSIYADEAIIGHSNEGDFNVFAEDEHSEALRDRIIAVQVPYNLRVGEEIKIYQKMMKDSKLSGVHLAPLTLRAASIVAVLSRLDAPVRQGMSMLDKLRLYDGQVVSPYTKHDVAEMQRHNLEEGMTGLSPRYVMNRIGAVASRPGVTCVYPLASLDSLWLGMRENVSLDQKDLTKYVGLVADAVKEYNALAIREIQKAYEESFEESANNLLESYLTTVARFFSGDDTDRADERDMREIERSVGVNDRGKVEFRQEIEQIVSAWRTKGWKFDYTSEPRLKAAIESQLFPAPRTLERALSEPRFARQKVEWAQRRSSIVARLISTYGYCGQCAADLIDYATHVLKNKPVTKTPKNETVEWLWPLDPVYPEEARAADSHPGG